jgi:hypothetical protein
MSDFRVDGTGNKVCTPKSSTTENGYTHEVLPNCTSILTSPVGNTQQITYPDGAEDVEYPQHGDPWVHAFATGADWINDEWGFSAGNNNRYEKYIEKGEFFNPYKK